MRAVVRCMLQQAEGRELAPDRTSTLGNLSPTAMPRACVRSICAERDRPRELRASMLSRQFRATNFAIFPITKEFLVTISRSSATVTLSHRIAM